jgi:hypothetical protein
MVQQQQQQQVVRLEILTKSVKVTAVQAWTGHEVPSTLKLPDFKTIDT